MSEEFDVKSCGCGADRQALTFTSYGDQLFSMICDPAFGGCGKESPKDPDQTWALIEWNKVAEDLK